MNAAEHYRQGERLLRDAQGEGLPEWAGAKAQIAMAHFAAAALAATPVATPEEGDGCES